MAYATLSPKSDVFSDIYAGRSIAITGLSVSFVGLPDVVPQDGKPHEFQVSVKSANHIDWKLPAASFKVWTGTSPGSGYLNPGTFGACDAEIDVRDPATKSWHRINAGGIPGDQNTKDVDLARDATGPVDDRVIDARITLGRNFKNKPDNVLLSFGDDVHPGVSIFDTARDFHSAVVAGAPDCVNPNAVDTVATSTTATPTKPSPSKAAGQGPELAFTGSSGTGTIAGLGAALLVGGGGIAFGLRRRGRRA
ncbi:MULTISPECIES: hypothetical protein [unclassified Kitasatospora]|uniref:hypothetical protein n=1 Tax=unclassified Kitasatospora TaxID=2633591 RepID=UPI0024746C55|nr:hypothetical protein [Kitasatospora sp. MAP12-44]